MRRPGYDARITTNASDPMLGRTLDGRYRIDREIGSGGFGVVYAGHHLTLDVPIAVKVLRARTDLPADQRAMLLERFTAEAQILARLRHPHVVSVLDFGVLQGETEGAVPWLVLEWCAGETLDVHLERRRGEEGMAPRSVADAWTLVRPIVDAVAHGHSLGVVHRDLKPANIMMVPTRGGSSPRVLDFGIAKRAPPEQIAAARTGPWTDVHALGLLFTELIMDRQPYPRGHASLAAVDPDRPSPARFGRDVGALEAVLAKAVSLRPAERYADAGALLDALDAVLGAPHAPPSLPSSGRVAASSNTPAFDPSVSAEKTGGTTAQSGPAELPSRSAAATLERPSRWGIRVFVAAVLVGGVGGAIYALALRTPAAPPGGPPHAAPKQPSLY